MLIEEVSRRLIRLLSLRSCTFQYGIAGVGSPARMQRDGQVTVGKGGWDVAARGLPADSGLELLVESGGLLRGRFLMSPEPGARPNLEQRLVAVAFAGQVGAALAGSRGARR